MGRPNTETDISYAAHARFTSKSLALAEYGVADLEDLFTIAGRVAEVREQNVQPAVTLERGNQARARRLPPEVRYRLAWENRQNFPTMVEVEGPTTIL